MIYFARWKTYFVLGLTFLGILSALPAFFPSVAPSFLEEQRIRLGLDLRGGAHLLLKADVGSVEEARYDALVDAVRRALREHKVGYKGLGRANQGIGFTLTHPEDEDLVRPMLRRTINERNEFNIDVSSDGTFNITFNEIALRELINNIMAQSVEVVRSRVDATGTSEPIIQRQGRDRILVQLPGEDPERIKKLLGTTAKLAFHMLDQATIDLIKRQEGKVPTRAFIAPAYHPLNPEQEYVVRKQIELTGERLENAVASFDSTRGGYVVNMKFDGLGARKFGRITKENVGKRFAVLLDGKVITAPVIREPIAGGNAQISGNFSAEEVNDLALLLRAGALPAPLTILEERSVGPSLGEDSVNAGRIASIIAFSLVIASMLFFYGLFGLFANVALLINLFLLTALLAFFGATLTLPGIAGIVLTIGMAVDANVLVFERIREELRNGRTPVNAIDRGYERALGTIIDANLTTFIAAFLLYLFGSGPIKGFAVTLSIGLATSMFSAIMLTRLMVVTWLRAQRRASIPL